MSYSKRYINIIIPEYNLPIFTYSVDIYLEISTGDILIIPYKKTTRFGIVIQVDVIPDIPLQKIRDIISKTNLPPISAKQLNFTTKAAEYYLGPLSSFFKMILPLKNLKDNLSLPADTTNSYEVQLNNLSLPQQVAFSEISSGFLTCNTVLFQGVTGSGKTEVYFHLINDFLKEPDAQILIMLPEIVLADTLVQKFAKQFNITPVIWHSSVTPAKKRKNWLRIVSGDAKVIIGARSALFLPFKKLKLVVVEEEHDQSYKQEEGIVYNARDMAILKGAIENIKVLLVSATPSIETYVNVLQNKYKIVKLTTRYLDVLLPTIEIADLKKKSSSNIKWLSDKLLTEIRATLAKNEQVLLFLNRRGYAPLTLCNACGHRFSCKNCSAWMVEHKAKKKLECHYCGNFMAIPRSCPECKCDSSIVACGPGVERINEEINELFPDSKTIIITKDSTHNPTQTNEIFQKIINNEVNVIIGTQLIAKGHHFPALSLVGVIDADLGLVGGDLRAAEKTYQLLEQVSGRAGREITKSKAIIQTYFPNSQIIKAIAEHDQEKFYLNEIAKRKANNMPPFAKFALLYISDASMAKARDFANFLIKNRPYAATIEVYGPTEGHPFKIRQKYRYKILIHTAKEINIQKFMRNWLEQVKVPSSIFLKIDIDPYNFM
jgi:primosomal protein N' (replication factor Y)